MRCGGADARRLVAICFVAGLRTPRGAADALRRLPAATFRAGRAAFLREADVWADALAALVLALLLAEVAPAFAVLRVRDWGLRGLGPAGSARSNTFGVGADGVAGLGPASSSAR